MKMRLQAIIKLKCSHCHEGPVFDRPFRMHAQCPLCGIRYEREDGYFMMAVFVGYVMSFFIVVPLLIILYLTIKPTVFGYLTWAVAALLLFSPLIFHYARVIWMHVDEILDPRPSPG
jgi:uncharacterized protein (DUF983 family)